LTNCTEEFTIIHPFHPAKGKTYEVLDRKKIWGDDRMFMLI